RALRVLPLLATARWPGSAVTAADSRKNPAEVRAMAPPAAIPHTADRHSPTPPLTAPTTAPTTMVGTIRSAHCRAVRAGTVSNDTARSVPTAGTAATIVTVTATRHTRSSTTTR